MKPRRPVSPRRPAVSPEDQALFLAAIGGATPLGTRDRLPIPPPPPSPVRVVELPVEVKLTVEGDSQRYAARAPGVSRAQLAELRGGRVHAEVTLDLHGEPVEAGKQQLRELLINAQRTGHRCVRVIHGKGLSSPNREPVLKGRVRRWLTQRNEVLAYCEAPQHGGGSGAVMVLLVGPSA